MDFHLLLQFLANAVVVGGLYGVLGLSFGLIYSTTQILHFAHGAIYVLVGYTFFTFYGVLDVPILAAIVLAIVLAGILGLGTMRGLYEPLLARRASGLTMMIASLGFFIVAENAIVLLFGNESRVVSKAAVSEGLHVGPVVVTPLQLVMVASAAAVFGVIYLLLTRSRLGRALRAMADDAGMAEIVGIDVRAMHYVVMALGSMVVAVVAILTALDVGIRPQTGLQVLLVAAVAVIIGGVGSLFGGILGGVSVGFLQNLGILYMAPKWQNLITFSALVIVLAVRPVGLLGRRV